MPKFQKTCNNPLHDDWSARDDGQVVNLAARGLVAVSNALELFVVAEQRKKPTHGINNLCKTCLQECFRKPTFTKFLPKDHGENLRDKVQCQVCALDLSDPIKDFYWMEKRRPDCFFYTVLFRNVLFYQYPHTSLT